MKRFRHPCLVSCPKNFERDKLNVDVIWLKAISEDLQVVGMSRGAGGFEVL